MHAIIEGEKKEKAVRNVYFERPLFCSRSSQLLRFDAVEEFLDIGAVFFNAGIFSVDVHQNRFFQSFDNGKVPNEIFTFVFSGS